MQVARPPAEQHACFHRCHLPCFYAPYLLPADPSSALHLELPQGWWAGKGQDLWRGKEGLIPDVGGFKLGEVFYTNQQMTDNVLKYRATVRACRAADTAHSMCGWVGAALHRAAVALPLVAVLLHDACRSP